MSSWDRRVGFIGLIVLACVTISQVATADVLITKRGSRYEGTVTEENGRYILVTQDGGRMTFPANMVEEVIEQELPAKPEVSPEAVAKASKAIKPLLESLTAASTAVADATTEVKRLHKEEVANSKPVPEAETVYDLHLGMVQGAIDDMKKAGARLCIIEVEGSGTVSPEGKHKWTLKRAFEFKYKRPSKKDVMPESKCTYTVNVNGSIEVEMVIVVTPRTARKVLKQAESDLADAKGPPKELLERHETELGQYVKLARGLSQAEQDLQDAEAALAEVADDPEKWAEQLQACQDAVEKAVDSTTTGLARLQEGPSLPQTPSEPEVSDGSPDGDG